MAIVNKMEGEREYNFCVIVPEVIKSSFLNKDVFTIHFEKENYNYREASQFIKRGILECERYISTGGRI